MHSVVGHRVDNMVGQHRSLVHGMVSDYWGVVYGMVGHRVVRNDMVGSNMRMVNCREMMTVVHHVGGDVGGGGGPAQSSQRQNNKSLGWKVEPAEIK